MVPGRGRQPLIAGQQRGIECFGQGDINGVIRCQISPQFSHPRQQDIVRIAVQRKVRQIDQSPVATFRVDLTFHRVSTKDLRHLDIDQVGRMKGLFGIEKPLFHSPRRRRVQ